MFSGFKERRPWAAALVTFIFDPFLGMLYLNRGIIGCAYLGLVFVAVVAVFAFLKPHYLAVPDIYFLWAVSIPIRIAGSAHSFIIARRRSSTETMRWYSHWYALILIGLLLPASGIAIRSFLYQPFDITSGSMNPTLNMGDHIYAEKHPYNYSLPHRGDVIVFRAPHHEGEDWVKRVVGMPGDRIQVLNGNLYVNGTAAQLRRIENFNADCDFGVCTPACQFIELLPGAPPHHILKAMDERPPDDLPELVVPAGNYFVLGDNRDNSVDSRNGLGFIPASAIVGKASIKWIDGTAHRWVWQRID